MDKELMGMNIICLYWVGDFRNRDFRTDDVWRLNQTVTKHIDRDYDFYVLTNDMETDLPGTKIKLLYNWPGWWSKMELFRPDLPCGRTLYMDLDSHVVNDLQPILDFEGDLVMFNTRMSKSMERKDTRIVCRYQAATMLFTPNAYPWVWNRFRENPNRYMKEFRGEQDMYGRWLPDLNTFPNSWMIKTESLRSKELPKDVIIVTGQSDRFSFRNPDFAPWLEEKARGDKVCM
jgi:hypothetical protein